MRRESIEEGNGGSATALEQNEGAHERAKEIAGGGKYEDIERALRDEGLFSAEVWRVKEKYAERLEIAEWMTEKDWEMLTVVELFDEGTAEHCVETYRIACDRVNRFNFEGKRIVERMQDEHVSEEEFFRACLFHDVGKCCIHREILNDAHTDEEWRNELVRQVYEAENENVRTRLLEGEGFDEDVFASPEALRAALDEKQVHAMRYVPFAAMLSEEARIRVTEQFPDINLETATLADLIMPHEEESERILRAKGFEKEADIAGKHHNYRNRALTHPIAETSLGVSATLEEVLALADMEQAMVAKGRAYKEGKTMVEALDIIIAEGKRHHMHLPLVAEWVAQELAIVSAEEKNRPEYAEVLDRIGGFIAQYKTEGTG